jgi:hypothetical protein
MADHIDRLNAALSGRYRVGRQIGEGGMAIVYAADDLRHGRKVALKVLRPELAPIVGAERFLTEIRTTANLQHPHILPLFDSGEADGLLFYAMPLVDGESLRERLGGDRGLYRVSASGGEPELILEQGSPGGEFRRIAQPHFLPGSRALLFHQFRTYDYSLTEVVALELSTGARTTIIADAMSPMYLDSGHLLFIRSGMLMAAGFDVDRFALQSEPVTLVGDVVHALRVGNISAMTGASQFVVSRAGHAVYAAGGLSEEAQHTLVRVTPDGEARPLGLPLRAYDYVRVSPDGGRLIFNAYESGLSQVYVHDLDRNVPQHLVEISVPQTWPAVWGPDGESIAFSFDPTSAVPNVYRMALDGSPPERVSPSAGIQRMGA